MPSGMEKSDPDQASRFVRLTPAGEAEEEEGRVIPAGFVLPEGYSGDGSGY